MKVFASGMNTVKTGLNPHVQKRILKIRGCPEKLRSLNFIVSFKSKRFVCYLIFYVCRFVYLSNLFKRHKDVLF